MVSNECGNCYFDLERFCGCDVFLFGSSVVIEYLPAGRELRRPVRTSSTKRSSSKSVSRAISSRILIRISRNRGLRYIALTMHQELRRYYGRREKTCGGVEDANPCLFANVGNVPEIPGYEIIDLIEGRQGDMKRVSNILAVKDPASDVSIGQHCGLVGKLQRVERLDKFQITGAVRLVDAFEFPLHERRDKDAVLRQFVLEPTDRQVAS